MLLDECVPRRLGRELQGHEVQTVAGLGWNGIKNGELLRLAAEEFDVFLTVDANLPYQQNRATLSISVIVLVARSNAIDVLRPLMPQVLEILVGLQRGELYRIKA